MEISSLLSKEAAGGGYYEWNSQLEEWSTEASTSTASEFLVHDDIRVPYSDEVDLGINEMWATVGDWVSTSLMRKVSSSSKTMRSTRFGMQMAPPSSVLATELAKLGTGFEHPMKPTSSTPASKYQPTNSSMKSGDC